MEDADSEIVVLVSSQAILQYAPQLDTSEPPGCIPVPAAARHALRLQRKLACCASLFVGAPCARVNGHPLPALADQLLPARQRPEPAAAAHLHRAQPRTIRLPLPEHRQAPRRIQVDAICHGPVVWFRGTLHGRQSDVDACPLDCAPGAKRAHRALALFPLNDPLDRTPIATLHPTPSRPAHHHLPPHMHLFP